MNDERALDLAGATMTVKPLIHVGGNIDVSRTWDMRKPLTVSVTVDVPAEAVARLFAVPKLSWRERLRCWLDARALVHRWCSCCLPMSFELDTMVWTCRSCGREEAFQYALEHPLRDWLGGRT